MNRSISLQEAARMCGGHLVGENLSARIEVVLTDSRNIQPKSLFFALRGKNYDGHQFALEAFQKGSECVVIDERAYSESQVFSSGKHPLIVVADVYQALGSFARAYRESFEIPMIAVTGSAGKTTTKECLRTLLGFWREARAGSGNLNNHIGLPLNLLNLSNQDQVGIFEIGASALGEIAYLCSILKPTIGVLTCIQPVHLEGFGSLENIYRAKLELADYLGKNDGTLFIYGDDLKLVGEAKKRCSRVKTFGRTPSCDYVLSEERQEGDEILFRVNQIGYFRLKGSGIFNAMNALVALAVSHHLGDSLQKASELWKDFVKVPNRFQFEELSHPHVGIVSDCYNANPISFQLALESFCKLETKGKRIVIAGDMLELGEQSEFYHRELGRGIGKLPIDVLLSVGTFAASTAAGARESSYAIVTETFRDNQSLSDFLSHLLHDGDFVLIKGSRGMRLEQIVENLKLKKEIVSSSQ